ncbi:uncharacterized protein ACNLHF_021191 [Anomaloglossus baeobatrachus]
MCHWKISTRFPQCQSHLTNMEMGIEQWFGRRTAQIRSLEIQVEYSTNLKMIAQALQSGITPLGILRNLPVEYDFALNHTDLWVNKWLGCERNICVGTSLIPVIGREGTIVPVTVLGIPVSNTQQVFYQLQYTDFAFDGVNTEQLDISSCLHFVSKVMCLPGRDKVIYHSCFHNHSCHVRIETVQTLHDLVTPAISLYV